MKLNKKQIIAGIIAGGLLFSATTASAANAASNSKTTSEAKTSIQWKSLKKYSKELWKSDNNINNELVALKLLDDKAAWWKKSIGTKQEVKSLEKHNKVSKSEKLTPPKKLEKVSEVKKNEQAVDAPKATPKQEVVKTPQATPKQNTVAPSKESEKVTENTTKSENSDQAQVSSVIQQVVDLTNAERANEGLAPLQIDSALTKSAQLKSQDMKDNNYFSHTSPTYGSPFDQMKTLGVSYKSAAENIAMGQRTAQEVVQGWMNSAGHRANIMNGSYTHIGVGLSDSGYYWTQQFISK